MRSFILARIFSVTSARDAIGAVYRDRPRYLAGFLFEGSPGGFGLTLSSLCCFGGDESMRFRTSSN